MNAANESTLAGNTGGALTIADALTGSGDGVLNLDGTKGAVNLNDGVNFTASGGDRVVNLSGVVNIDVITNNPVVPPKSKLC